MLQVKNQFQTWSLCRMLELFKALVKHNCQRRLATSSESCRESRNMNIEVAMWKLSGEMLMVLRDFLFFHSKRFWCQVQVSHQSFYTCQTIFIDSQHLAPYIDQEMLFLWFYIATWSYISLNFLAKLEQFWLFHERFLHFCF